MHLLVCECTLMQSVLAHYLLAKNRGMCISVCTVLANCGLGALWWYTGIPMIWQGTPKCMTAVVRSHVYCECKGQIQDQDLLKSDLDLMAVCKHACHANATQTTKNLTHTNQGTYQYVPYLAASSPPMSVGERRCQAGNW